MTENGTFFTQDMQWSYYFDNFANASMMTENGTFCGQKLHPFYARYGPLSLLETSFFQ
jgi:hypothetical protein